ncbi:alpha-hydroxy acid oxidase [Paraburkholderia sediminicola]|uniref:Alpha-hydroxy acid oxidase n=1 Tax=Paraburkholderia metrosideri TaxID=580937 RepID=A0ABW9DVM6_9BURK
MSNPLARVYSIDDLARLARRRLPRAVFDFYAGGTEDELTLDRNRVAFKETAFAPRVLRDVGTINTACTLVGGVASMPLAIAPMGAVGFGRRGGDIAMAKAAAMAGIPFTLSTTATTSIEAVAREAGGRLWFQIYALKQNTVALSLIDRAREAGYEVLVVTADVPVGGKRERDLRNDFGMPFRFSSRNVLDFASRPMWALDMLIKGLPTMENLAGLAPSDTGAVALAASVGREFDPGFDWHQLRVFRRRWPGKLLLKGIMRADDAVCAIECGCDGVIVSNHGGRQLDGTVSTLTALPRIASAVGTRGEVLLDGGIRRGSDIVKALALGAAGVLVGRPALYGVCAAGQPGVKRALEILEDELVRTLKLCGIPRLRDVTADVLWQSVEQHSTSKVAPRLLSQSVEYERRQTMAQVGETSSFKT